MITKVSAGTVSKEIIGFRNFLIFLPTLPKHKGGRVRCAAPVHDLVISYLVTDLCCLCFSNFQDFST